MCNLGALRTNEHCVHVAKGMAGQSLKKHKVWQGEVNKVLYLRPFPSYIDLYTFV